MIVPSTHRTARGNGDRPYKILNNNVVVTMSEVGNERVLMGRGLGYALKSTGTLDLSAVEKTFILDSGLEGDRVRQLLTDVPYPVIEAVNVAVDRVERLAGRDLGRRFAIAVIDHVQFVLERLANGISIPASAVSGLRVLYPAEYAIASEMTASMSASLDVRFPDVETTFLTMHVLNATRDEFEGTASVLFRRVERIVTLVEKALDVTFDGDSADYARFVLHVQFLLQRLEARSMLQSGDSSFYEYARRTYQRSLAIASDVRDYIESATGAQLTDEEMLYVIVHVERLTQSVLNENPPNLPQRPSANGAS